MELASGDYMSFEEKDKFWDLIYAKIKKAIGNGHTSAYLFGLQDIVDEGQPTEEISDYIVTIHQSEYSIFLDNYLTWCEEQERYEKCIEISQLIKKNNKNYVN